MSQKSQGCNKKAKGVATKTKGVAKTQGCSKTSPRVQQKSKDLKKCDPRRGQEAFTKRVKNIASGGKRAQKVGARRCYAYVGGFGVLKKSPK